MEKQKTQPKTEGKTSTNKQTGIYQDKEHEGVYRLDISSRRFIELMGGEVTLWDKDHSGELKNPQHINEDTLEKLNLFFKECEGLK